MTLGCYFWYFLELAASYHNADFFSRQSAFFSRKKSNFGQNPTFFLLLGTFWDLSATSDRGRNDRFCVFTMFS